MEYKAIEDLVMPNIVPGVYGDVEITKNDAEGTYTLYHNQVRWMVTDLNFKEPADLFYSQYDLAYGNVLLTGLGFGIMATALAQKEEVSSVTVLEISADVIDAFVKNNPNNPKINIILANASEYETDVTYDCLLPDHYAVSYTHLTLPTNREV